MLLGYTRDTGKKKSESTGSSGSEHSYVSLFMTIEPSLGVAPDVKETVKIVSVVPCREQIDDKVKQSKFAAISFHKFQYIFSSCSVFRYFICWIGNLFFKNPSTGMEETCKFPFSDPK